VSTKNTITKPARTLPAFKPVPREKEPASGWTPARQQAFIEVLADTSGVKSAARAGGLSAKSAHDLRRAKGAEPFRKAWEAARDIGIQMIEDVAMDRALNGVEEPVFAYGKFVGTRRVYNDQLLMFMLRSRAAHRFATDRARAMNGADKFTLARLKKQWRAEWERERAILEAEQEVITLESLNAKLDRMREAELAREQFALEPPRYTRGEPGEQDRKPYSSPIRSAAMKASCGMLTFPYSRIRALPFFCFSSSFFLRVMSPP